MTIDFVQIESLDEIALRVAEECGLGTISRGDFFHFTPMNITSESLCLFAETFFYAYLDAPASKGISMADMHRDYCIAKRAQLAEHVASKVSVA